LACWVLAWPVWRSRAVATPERSGARFRGLPRQPLFRSRTGRGAKKGGVLILALAGDSRRRDLGARFALAGEVRQISAGGAGTRGLWGGGASDPDRGLVSKPAICSGRVAAKAAPTEVASDPRPELEPELCGRGLLTPTAACIGAGGLRRPCRGRKTAPIAGFGPAAQDPLRGQSRFFNASAARVKCCISRTPTSVGRPVASIACTMQRSQDTTSA
jgi:hypothetical protein